MSVRSQVICVYARFQVICMSDNLCVLEHRRRRAQVICVCSQVICVSVRPQVICVSVRSQVIAAQLVATWEFWRLKALNCTQTSPYQLSKHKLRLLLRNMSPRRNFGGKKI